jgi:hypothetical protein
LDGPLPKLCPVIPTSNQDGHQAQNRKKGDEILIVHCCFSVSQNELKFNLQLPHFFLICIIGQNLQKFKIHQKNPVIYAKKLIIMLIQFKFGHILA